MTRVLLLSLLLLITPDHQPTPTVMREEAVTNGSVTSDPDWVNNSKKVEERLELTCKKLCETEVNIRLFSKMVRHGVATNDVRNFAAKQAMLKSMNHKMNADLVRKAMKSKLTDACNLAHRLRVEKVKLCNLLREKFKFPKKKCRRILKKSLGEAANHRHEHMIKTKRKYIHCEKKMMDESKKCDFSDIPDKAWEILKNVTLFSDKEVVPEQCAEPMVCSPEITLSKAEMSFLKKGPRFMLRQEVSEREFKVELEKMTVKDKFNTLNKGGDLDTSSSSSQSDSLSEEAENEEARSAMPYLKSEKCLDLSKMRSTDYKFNKRIFLPKHEPAEKEALHEARRLSMLNIFRKTTKDMKKKDISDMDASAKDKNMSKIESNLTKSELAGMKSLQKRVQNNELIITETDKSRRFCVLKYDQYFASGLKHTSKDMKVSNEQVKSLQKVVNDHTVWLRRIFSIGAKWGHEERLENSMVDRGEVVAPLYLLVKDHKGWFGEDQPAPPSRPVCSGNAGYNRHLSEIVSLILEPLGHAAGGCDIDSTGSLLAEVDKLNKNLKTKNWNDGAIDSNDKCTCKVGSIDPSQVKKVCPRSFGDAFKNFSRDLKLKRIANLRNLRQKSSVAPNLKARLWALRIMDEVNSNEPLRLPCPKDDISTQCPSSCTNASQDLHIVSENTQKPDMTSLELNENVEGCSRATLKSPTDCGEQNVIDQGCSRATLKPPTGCGEQDENVLGGSRATLKAPTVGGEKDDNVLGSSRATPKSPSECEEQNIPDLECSRATLIDCPVERIQPNKSHSWSAASQVESYEHNVNSQIKGKQSNKVDDYTIVGNDVEALFPSLRDVECARITRRAIETSAMKFENVDIVAALKYLRLVGGDEHINEIGLKRIAPKWLGPRPDLLTLGGEAASEDKKWSKMKKELTDHEVRLVIARVIEVAILVCMSTHIYSFGPNLYLQCTGGPIGMRFTASLANLVMKEWDKAWINLLNREKIDFDLFLRYVDDCRLFMRSLEPGWIWEKGTFVYSHMQEIDDHSNGVTSTQRTTREITKAMCEMTEFLVFTGEDCSMFTDGYLPTLDTSLKVKEGQIQYKFFEKPTVGNQVLNKDTALPAPSLRASLLQETVRRLLNCSPDLDHSVRSDILSRFGEKLINSGHSIKSARITMVQGVVKFLWKVEQSKKPLSDPAYRPLYLSKEYEEENRQINKYRAKMGWFRSKMDPEVSAVDRKDGWRLNLKGVWRGTNMSQKQALNKGYSTVISVPNTKGSVLVDELIKVEKSLAELTNYNVKIIEQSGVQLCRLFQRIHTPVVCHRNDCPVCEHNDGKKSSKCKMSNVVYEAKCLECVELLNNNLLAEKDVGVYVGETSRTLMERALEHVAGANKIDIDNFITKHWATKHSDLTVKPRMKFSVIKKCKDALSRQVSEAVWIENHSNLNSKSEWGRNSLTRLMVDNSTWVNHSDEDKLLKREELVLLEFKKQKETNHVVGYSRAPLNGSKDGCEVAAANGSGGGEVSDATGCSRATLITSKEGVECTEVTGCSCATLKTDSGGGEDCDVRSCSRATLITSDGGSTSSCMNSASQAALSGPALDDVSNTVGHTDLAPPLTNVNLQDNLHQREETSLKRKISVL